jgi:hypothetical protein
VCQSPQMIPLASNGFGMLASMNRVSMYPRQPNSSPAAEMQLHTVPKVSATASTEKVGRWVSWKLYDALWHRRLELGEPGCPGGAVSNQTHPQREQPRHKQCFAAFASAQVERNVTNPFAEGNPRNHCR